jgi:hypothetical protein
MSGKNAVPAEQEFETPVDRSQTLPPLAILQVGNTIDFVLREVNEVEDEDNTKKPRIFYRAQLLKELVCETRKKGAEETEEVTFAAGDMVSLPGSGSLDYTMARIAKVKAKVALDSKSTPWEAVYNDRFIVTRKEDEVLEKGKHAGKPVKAFKVEHAQAKKK